MLTFYGLKTCDTCRKATKALEAAGVEATVIDVREAAGGDLAAQLPGWIAAVGADALVNRRSTTWRGLSDAEKAEADTAEGAAALLAAHPTLIKRPVIIAGADIHIGWTPAVRSALGVD